MWNEFPTTWKYVEYVNATTYPEIELFPDDLAIRTIINLTESLKHVTNMYCTFALVDLGLDPSHVASPLRR